MAASISTPDQLVGTLETLSTIAIIIIFCLLMIFLIFYVASFFSEIKIPCHAANKPHHWHRVYEGSSLTYKLVCKDCGMVFGEDLGEDQGGDES